jgi:hypothetical protein
VRKLKNLQEYKTQVNEGAGREGKRKEGRKERRKEGRKEVLILAS